MIGDKNRLLLGMATYTGLQVKTFQTGRMAGCTADGRIGIIHPVQHQAEAGGTEMLKRLAIDLCRRPALSGMAGVTRLLEQPFVNGGFGMAALALLRGILHAAVIVAGNTLHLGMTAVQCEPTLPMTEIFHLVSAIMAAQAVATEIL